MKNPYAAYYPFFFSSVNVFIWILAKIIKFTRIINSVNKILTKQTENDTNVI